MRPPNDPLPKRRRFGDSSSPSAPLPSSSPFPTFPAATSAFANPHPLHASSPFPASLSTPNGLPVPPADLFSGLPFPQLPNLDGLQLPPFTPAAAAAASRFQPHFIPPTTAASSSLPAASPSPRTPQKRPAPSLPPMHSPKGRPRPLPNGLHRPVTSSSSSPRTLGSIGPVVDALALLSDDSPIIAALAHVLSPAPAPATRTSARQRILSFRGFAQCSNPNFHALLVLSKVDLDILAWIFTVSKNGRKDDVARRILSSLKAPLAYRTPPPTRRPPALKYATRVGPTSPVHSAVQRARSATYGGGHAAQHHSKNQRGSMPNLAPARSAPISGDFLLHHLEQQLQGSRNGNSGGSRSGYTAMGGGVVGAGHVRVSAAQNRSKQMRDLVHEVLAGYDFSVGENPFNHPMYAPLGAAKNYVIFSSMQLSRGNSDPVLMFPTPQPIDPNVRPEIRGGDLQIHLRCLKVEVEKPKAEWKQAWPFPASCRVNGHMVTLNQAQRYTNGKLAGLDTATNITPYLRKYKGNSNESNRITLRRQSSTATPASGQFVLFAQEILVYSRDTMANRVHEASDKYWVEYRRLREEKGVLSPSTSKFEMARQGVVHFLTDPDGLTVSSMKVSLRCPLALTRITTPVKGKRCQHVQCFDLINFLEYSRRSSKFDCPVCNKNTAYPAMLVISPYIEHALEKYKDSDEVEIFQDGSMVPVERKQTGVASDDEDEGGSGAQANGTSHGGSKPSEVVDLTLDSDDDDPPSVITAEEITPNLQNVGLSMVTAVDRGGQTSVVSDGQSQHIEDTIMHSTSDEQEVGNDVGNGDQEFDFTFRSDFAPVPWGDGQAGEELAPAPVRLPQVSNAADNWPVDVIAIDSD